MKNSFLTSLLVAAVSFAPMADACSAFQFKQGQHNYLAKNHDFMIGEGHLTVNTRGRAKHAVMSTTPLSWVAKHGSVTYNQFGREFPNAGMNEAGLVVEMLWLNEAGYPAPDARPTLGVLQWVQYQLDTATTLEDVLASDQQVRISDPAGNVHFFVTDKTGDTAVIEWIAGKRLVHRGKDLPVAAVANDAYTPSAQCRAEGKGFDDPVVQTLQSYDRFLAVAKGATEPAAKSAETHAFAVLEKVRHPDYTQFQLFYAPNDATLTLMRKHDRVPRTVQFSSIDFSPSATALVYDLSQEGAIVWQPATHASNRTLVFKTYRGTPFLAHIPDEALEGIAATPESFATQVP